MSNAFLFKRHNTPYPNQVKECIDNGYITLGWPEAEIPVSDYGNQRAIRDILEHGAYAAHYKDDANGNINHYRSGTVARHFRYFLGEMKVDDYIITTKPGKIFVGKVTGEPQYKGDVAKDISYTRSVTWSNKEGYSPKAYGALLAGRLKVRSASARMRDCVVELKSLVEKGEQSPKARLYEELTKPLVKAIGGDKALAVFNDRGFEELVLAYFRACGANGKVIPRRNDKGIDVVVTMPVNNIEQVTDSTLRSLLDPVKDSLDGEESICIGIQVKQHQDKTQLHALEQLKDGIDDANASAEPIHLGIVISSGNEIESKESKSDEYDPYPPIACWNGEDFAMAILETGLGRVFEAYEKKH